MLWIVQYYGKLLLIIINHAMVFIYKSQYIWPEWKQANLDDYCTEVVLLCWLIYLNSVYIDYSNTKYETFTFQIISLL